MSNALTLDQWEALQLSLDGFTDHLKAQIDRAAFAHDFLLYQSEDPQYPSALKLKGILQRDLGLPVSIKPDPLYNSLDERERWLFYFTLPSGERVEVSAGQVLAELAEPAGFSYIGSSNDRETYFIGVDQLDKGRARLLKEKSVAGIWFEWIPEQRPAPPKPPPSESAGSQLTGHNVFVGFDQQAATLEILNWVRAQKAKGI